MNNYPSISLANKNAIKVVVFFASSTGDGDSPENGLQFRAWIEQLDGADIFSHVFYTLLGLGDSNYNKYQGNPRALDAALIRLGAQGFYEKGEADEATSLELVVDPWMEGAPKALVDTLK